jgi:hypothetical protein
MKRRISIGVVLLALASWGCTDEGGGSTDVDDTGVDVAHDVSDAAEDDAARDVSMDGDGSDDGSVSDSGDSGGGDAGPYEYDESEYDDFVDTSTHYRFPLDEDGWAVIEPGEQHQTIYVSNDGDDGNDGLSEDAPLATLEAARGMMRQGSSDWVLLRRGDTFSQTRFREELNGESPEHPMVLGAYGEGPRPVVEGALRLWATHRNVVIRDIELRKVGKFCLDVLGTIENLFIENVVTKGCESRIQGSSDPKHAGVTLRRSMILDGHLGEPVNGASDWSAVLDNRLSGIYVANVNGLFIEECYADRSGWEPGYDPELGPGPHPPSKYSHNFYLQRNNENIVFRGTISSRGASFGAQVRPGGVVQRNVFVGNNAAFFTAGDNPSLIEENVVTIAGNKVATEIGARGWGISASDVAGTVLRGNVVVHSVDPLGSVDEDFANNGIHNTDGTTMSDNVVWDWGSAASRPESLPAGVQPDSVSWLNYAGETVGEEDFAAMDEALRARDRQAWPAFLSAPVIVDYFAEYRE